MILDEFFKSLIFHEFRYFFQIFKVTESIINGFFKSFFPVLEAVNNMGITIFTAEKNDFNNQLING
jgi:hypothetical protein